MIQTRRFKGIGEQGFTLVENLVALGILAIICAGLFGGMVIMQKLSTTSRMMSASDKQISDIADNIRVALESHQIDFGRVVKGDAESNIETINSVLDPSRLPMAWDVGVTGTAKDCPQCKGRYGFVIQPFERFPGLYLVTLRMTNQSWSVPYRDYQFVVSAR